MPSTTPNMRVDVGELPSIRNSSSPTLDPKLPPNKNVRGNKAALVISPVTKKAMSQRGEDTPRICLPIQSGTTIAVRRETRIIMRSIDVLRRLRPTWSGALFIILPTAAMGQ
jgi:hypothetical protein